jgi:hypothetical protein
LTNARALNGAYNERRRPVPINPPTEERTSKRFVDELSATTIEHQLQLEVVGIGEDDGVIVGRVLHRGRIEDRRVDLLEQPVKAVDLSAAVAGNAR